MNGDPDLAGTPESNAEHAVGEHTLHTGGCHALVRGDGSGIGDLTTRSDGRGLRRPRGLRGLGGLRGNLEQ